MKRSASGRNRSQADRERDVLWQIVALLRERNADDDNPGSDAAAMRDLECYDRIVTVVVLAEKAGVIRRKEE